MQAHLQCANVLRKSSSLQSYTAETRLLLQNACINNAGMSAIQVAFIIGQSFLSTLCAMRWGAFVFYAAFVAIAVVFVLLFIPETKVRPASPPLSPSFFPVTLRSHGSMGGISTVPCVCYFPATFNQTGEAQQLDIMRPIILHVQLNGIHVVQGVPIERMTEVWESHWLWRRAGQHGAHMERLSLDPGSDLLASGQA